MKRVASHESLAYLGHLKNMLEQADIACLIKNEQLSGGLGEIPFLECLPELWILKDEQAARAARLLAELERVDSSGPAWTCSACGERNEPQFGACWQCGRADETATE